MPSLDGVILDMDGVLWHGDTPVPRLADVFAAFDGLGIAYVLATNNAMKVADQYTEKLASFGVEIAAERILTSAEATAGYLRRSHPEATAVFAVGEEGLRRALRAQGFEVLTPAEVRGGARAPVVVAGLVRESLSYELLAMASLLILEGASFVGTNGDATYPTEIGLMPGAGAILALLSTSTGVTPTVIGKPHPAMFEEALRRLGSAPARTAMIGDRLGTDIAGGKAAGLRTVLVLSGVSSEQEVETGEVRPDLVVRDVHAFVATLQQPGPP